MICSSCKNEMFTSCIIFITDNFVHENVNIYVIEVFSLTKNNFVVIIETWDSSGLMANEFTSALGAWDFII